MFYRARFYSPVLGRFISADTLVPKPENPQTLNRFAYTLNNPLRYIDPTGHFEDDALKAYLQNLYGKDWETYWNTWTKDNAWMDLLHNLESGDMMSKITAGVGGAQIDNFGVIGIGKTRLDAIMRYGENGLVPASLQEMYASMDEHTGIGAVGYASGDVIIRGSVGNVSYQNHVVTEANVRERGAGMGLTLGVVGYVCPLCGIVSSILGGVFNIEVNGMPGMIAGDNELTIGTFYGSGPPDDYYGTPITPGTRSGYEYTFRNGQIISEDGYSYQFYVPHRR